MGRARKIMSQQTGNLTVEIQKQRQFEESLADVGKSEFLTPPDWLIDEVAVGEWDRTSKILIEEISLIGDLDICNLGGYCNSFAMYVKATKLLSGADLCSTVDGKIIENPLIATQRKYADEMRKFGRLCGLNIDSRLKFAAEKAKEIDGGLEEKFGGI